jgi:hypothetical protein
LPPALPARAVSARLPPTALLASTIATRTLLTVARPPSPSARPSPRVRAALLLRATLAPSPPTLAPTAIPLLARTTLLPRFATVILSMLLLSEPVPLLATLVSPTATAIPPTVARLPPLSAAPASPPVLARLPSRTSPAAPFLARPSSLTLSSIRLSPRVLARTCALTLPALLLVSARTLAVPTSSIAIFPEAMVARLTSVAAPSTPLRTASSTTTPVAVVASASTA